MNGTRWRGCLLLGVGVLGLACVGRAEENWQQLFNGKNLEGWTPKIRGYAFGENFGNTFRVEDGVIKVAYDGYDKFDERFGHLFYKDKFSHYRLRVEYRFVGEQCPGGPGWAIRNSGIMFHCQDPATMALGQDFPASIEAQMLAGNGKDKRTTANLCTPYTHVVMKGELVKRHCTTSQSETYHGDQWVTMELEVRGSGVVKHRVNGQEVLTYEQPQWDTGEEIGRSLAKGGSPLITEGYISLQSESHPLEFRKVEVLVLQP